MTRKHQPTDPSPRPFHDSNRPTAVASASGEREAIVAAVLEAHQKSSSGMSAGTPDTCRCGERTLYERGDEDVTIRRDRSFAAHQAAAITQALTQALAQDGEQAARDRAAAPSRAAVNAMARVLIAEWERVEAPVTPSYIATFADLARAALTYTTASERSGK